MKNIVTIIILTSLHFISYAQTADDILHSFKQGHSGDFNCTSIAIIKCAMSAFGIDGGCQIRNNNGDYQVTLRNGASMMITQAQLNASNNSNGFLFLSDSSILREAQLLYAVMAMRATQLSPTVSRFSNCTTFTAALQYLHAGVGLSADSLAILLGYKTKDIGFDKRTSEKAFIVGNNFHAAFGSMGNFDDYGDRVTINRANFREHMVFLGGRRNQLGISVLTD